MEELLNNELHPSLYVSLPEDVELYLDSTGKIDISKITPDQLVINIEHLKEANLELYELF